MSEQERFLAEIKRLLEAEGGLVAEYGTGPGDQLCLYVTKLTYGYPTFQLALEHMVR